ncbi:MAG: DUF4835 domain-containing protein [Verrucomicrobia bacterium]|nr:DUF4835 domain-containing protein [Verrucomicrobiota bacterium]|tara:strand:+ start:443 stop:1336 length:894 start_codon:yes stop_codon:yes gene_type:complete
MVTRILLLFTLFTLMLCLPAQELNCIVNVDARQVEGSERLMFEEMQKALFQLVNGQKWTKDEFKTEERIDCSILINLTERLTANEYRGNIQVQASRPVYNTSYKSPIMNVRDEDFVIRYNQFEPLQFNEGSYSGELTTIVAFYIYMILGYDYDSFAPEGGTSYFQEAQRIVTNAQSSSQKGWRSFESQRNRYWLIENALSARFKPLRKAYYAYHRNGFDVLESDPSKARNVIAESLQDLLPVHNVEPSSYNMQVFFNAKSQELVKLYEKATPSEIEKISELLIRIDPGNANRYEKLR